MAQVKVTLIHSAAHRQPTQRRTVKALGSGKINSLVILLDNAATRDQISKIVHLVSVKEAKQLKLDNREMPTNEVR